MKNRVAMRTQPRPLDDLTRKKPIYWDRDEIEYIAVRVLKARARNPTGSLTTLLDNAQQGLPADRRRSNINSSNCPKVIETMSRLALDQYRELDQLRNDTKQQKESLEEYKFKLDDAEGKVLELDDETFLTLTRERVFTLTSIDEALEYYNLDEMFRLIPQDRILGGAVEIFTKLLLEPKEINLSEASLGKLAKMLTAESLTLPATNGHAETNGKAPVFSHSSPPAPRQSIINHRSILVAGVMDHQIEAIADLIQPKNANVCFLRQKDRDPQLIKEDTCLVIKFKRYVPKPQAKMINRRWRQLGRSQDNILAARSYQEVIDTIKSHCNVSV